MKMGERLTELWEQCLLCVSLSLRIGYLKEMLLTSAILKVNHIVSLPTNQVTLKRQQKSSETKRMFYFIFIFSLFIFLLSFPLSGFRVINIGAARGSNLRIKKKNTPQTQHVRSSKGLLLSHY